MKPKVSEKLLLLKIKTKKDPDAFANLYDLYIEKIYRFVYFKVNNKEEAEDIVSDVFLKVWNYLIESKKREIESFSGLIYQITRNKVIDYYRKKAKEKNYSLEDVVILAPDKNFAKIETNLEVERLLKYIKKLKSDYQEVLMLRYIEDLGIGEIAKILDKKKTNVRVILHRATKKLKQIIGE